MLRQGFGPVCHAFNLSNRVPCSDRASALFVMALILPEVLLRQGFGPVCLSFQLPSVFCSDRAFALFVRALTEAPSERGRPRTPKPPGSSERERRNRKS